jgi:putative endonuclease
MRDGEMLVFLEVRLRSSNDFGGAAASIDRHKQAKLIRSAQDYLAKFPQYPPCRFDALLLVTPEGESGFEWIKNAFEV